MSVLTLLAGTVSDLRSSSVASHATSSLHIMPATIDLKSNMSHIVTGSDSRFHFGSCSQTAKCPYLLNSVDNEAPAKPFHLFSSTQVAGFSFSVDCQCQHLNPISFITLNHSRLQLLIKCLRYIFINTMYYAAQHIFRLQLQVGTLFKLPVKTVVFLPTIKET